MNRTPQTARWRILLFFALVAFGLVYIGTFVWFKKHSVDFVERNRNDKAAVAAAAVQSPDIDWTFEQDSPALAMLGTGWRAGSEGAWSRRQGGEIFLPSSIAAGRELGIRFDGHLNPPEREVTVTLDANGEMIGQWRLTHQKFEVVARVRLPSQRPGVDPWRLKFVIERPREKLWRGYEPVLLIYGLYLREVRTVAGTSNGQDRS